jgi:sodium/potassium-transporting ATPase subunit alpha
MTEMKARLKSAESKLLTIHRRCKGDASETGLVQFAEAIMSLNDTRDKAPTHKFKNDAGKETEVIIPFNSEFKFNLFVRDLGLEKGGLTVFMKGAPERILTRCDQILLNDEEIPFTEELRQEIDDANKSFGRLGERVLAFARYSLDPSKYNSTYPFGWYCDWNYRF